MMDAAVARRASLREQLLARILAAVPSVGETYSTAIARELGERISRVQTCLKILERQGSLVSRYELPEERHGRSGGLQRKYYRLARAGERKDDRVQQVPPSTDGVGSR